MISFTSAHLDFDSHFHSPFPLSTQIGRLLNMFQERQYLCGNRKLIPLFDHDHLKQASDLILYP